MHTSLHLLLVVSVSLVAPRAAACVASGGPASRLCEWLQSDDPVVVARVERESLVPLDLGDGDVVYEHVQHLQVLYTVKGSAPVRFRRDLGWSTVAHLPAHDGRARLFRIWSRFEPEGPEPMVRAEESLLESLGDLHVQLDRLNEWARLQERGSAPEETHEWLVRCALRRATRGSAVKALRAADGEGAQSGGHPTGALTPAQRLAILDGFRQEPSTDTVFVDVLELGRGVQHAAFDRVAVGVVQTLLFETDGNLAPELPRALYLLMERLGVPDLEARWSAVQAALDAGAREAAASSPAPETSGDGYLVDGVRDATTVAADEAAQRVLRAAWDALRAEGRLPPAPRVQHAWSD